MIVKITYDDKRLDVFDTATFTCPAPLGKQNMLTNFEVRFDEMGTEGLWLAAHSYRIDDSTASNTEADEVPIARRKKGWRFLLSSSEELDHVELVVVDGEAIIKRVCGELVDLQSFDEKAYECIGAPPRGCTSASATSSSTSKGSRERQSRSSQAFPVMWHVSSSRHASTPRVRKRPKRNGAIWMKLVGSFTRWLIRAVFRFM